MIQTTIHTYNFDVSRPADAAAYAKLRSEMEARGTECFESWGQGSHYVPSWDGRIVTLETAFVFENKWNTAPVEGISDKGLRVFDWAQDFEPNGNKHRKRGHYLDLTPAMIEVRANRLTCGYCGKQYDKRENPPAFCRDCLGSQYLRAEELHLTRVAPVGFKTKRAPLTAEESAAIMPIYQAEQAGKGSERAREARAKLGQRIEREYEESRRKYETKHRGRKWLFDAGCPVRLLENCIYYDHKGVFTFGWRDKLTEGADLDWLMANLSEFPYEYNIETAHRGTIGGRE